MKTYTKYLTYGWMCSLLMIICSCGSNYSTPADSTPVGRVVNTYPDYRDVTIPPNIAPLNFIVKSDAKEYVVQVQADGKEVLVAGGDEDRVVKFEPTEWSKVLDANKGKELVVTVFENNQNGWQRYNPYKLYVAEEDIDPYLSYRLIEPGFEMYRQVGLYQRNLTDFTQKVIYENNRSENSKENHCVNCHNYQNYSTDKMLFHVRANMGGTIIAKDGKIEKLNFKCDSILGSAVYPSWNPHKNYLVFSSNKTGQAFHMLDVEKIEVLDYGSDLLFYNADTHEVSNIIKNESTMETFPAWSPEGKKIYFCQAVCPDLAGKQDSAKIVWILNNYKSLHYNVMSVTFDESNMSFGEPRLEVNCDSMHKSATVPRVSPDGKYLLFTLGDFGQFHIWHKSSDQWVKNLETGEIYPLSEANSDDVDSYHSWSSNGRWIVFSSRRNDGSYTRPYIAYFDKNGRSRKAFMLPQEDPNQNLMLLKSYNVPELTREAVKYTPEQFKDVIYNQVSGTDIKYRELRSADAIESQRTKAVMTNDSSKQTAGVGVSPHCMPNADAVSGASPKAR